MDSHFSLCLCHPRSQPARSDKRYPRGPHGLPSRYAASQSSPTSASLPVPAKRNHGPRIRPPPAYGYRPPPSRTGPSSRRPECRSSRAVHGCACLEIIKPCLQSTASYLCVLVTTLEDGAVIEPSRMPFESSCPSLRLFRN
ncbi:uncharacterized protein LOC144152437 isoform X1 [Haemaphysalis longicornis]